MRCTHENALIEELEALAEWCLSEPFGDPHNDEVFNVGVVCGVNEVAEHILNRIATLRAQRAPVRYTEG